MEGKVQEQIAKLNALIGAGKLKADDASFGASLCASFEKYGKLTPKQAPWVQKLIDKAHAPAPVAIPVGEFSGVIDLFKKAKQHLKWPAIVLLDESTGDEIKLKMAGDNSQNPGCIYAYVEHEYAGKVKPDGAFVYAKDYHWLSKLLTVLAADPAKVAAAHGKLTGKCCFCNAKLTDPKSTSVGYGPVCAKHYGLPHGPVKIGEGASELLKEMDQISKNELAGELIEEAADEMQAEAQFQSGTMQVPDNDCGQCEGTGTLQEGSSGAGEMCPVCDGAGTLPMQANGFVDGLVSDLEMVFGPGHVFTEEDLPVELNQQAVEDPDYTPPLSFEEAAAVEVEHRRERIEFEKVPGKAVKNLLEAMNAQTDA
jgi:hypothetical protein